MCIVFLVKFGRGPLRPNNLTLRLSISNISFRMMHNYNEKPTSGKERMDGKEYTVTMGSHHILYPATQKYGKRPLWWWSEFLGQPTMNLQVCSPWGSSLWSAMAPGSSCYMILLVPNLCGYDRGGHGVNVLFGD